MVDQFCSVFRVPNKELGVLLITFTKGFYADINNMTVIPLCQMLFAVRPLIGFWIAHLFGGYG